MSHLTDVVELLGGVLLLDVRQESLEGNFCKLLTRQNQTKAPVLDISESLNKGSDRFIISLPQVGQIRQLHLLYTRVEELVELLLQISQYIIELAGNVVNHVKANADKDIENKHTFNASC